MSHAGSIELPQWAVVGSGRLAHIERVVKLLEGWAAALRLDSIMAKEWRDAGLLHDSLRDAPEATLRELLPDSTLPHSLLHGPAAAAMLEREGERREGLLDAIRWHTVGCADWGLTGKALYCADFLEPGRSFDREVRADLAARFAADSSEVLRSVVKMRLERALRKGYPLQRETVELWNSIN